MSNTTPTEAQPTIVSFPQAIAALAILQNPELIKAPAAQPITHTDRDIYHGQARIVWATEQGALKPGWALPGGMRTTSEEHARECARALNDDITSQANGESKAAA